MGDGELILLFVHALFGLCLCGGVQKFGSGLLCEILWLLIRDMTCGDRNLEGRLGLTLR